MPAVATRQTPRGRRRQPNGAAAVPPPAPQFGPHGDFLPAGEPFWGAAGGNG